MNYINKSTPFFVVLATNRDYYNIHDWEIHIHNLDVQTTVNETSNVQITEIVHTIDTITTTTTTVDNLKNSKFIVVPAGGGSSYTKGQVLKIDTGSEIIYRRVKNVAGDILYMTVPLSMDLPKDTTLTTVGNTGDYRVMIDPTTLVEPLHAEGRYLLQAKSDSAGIDITTSLFRVTGYDVQSKLGGDIKYIKEALDNLSGGAVTATISIASNPSRTAPPMSLYASLKVENGDTLDLTVTPTTAERFIHVVDGTANIDNENGSYTYGSDTLIFIKNITVSKEEYDSLAIEHVVILPGVNITII